MLIPPEGPGLVLLAVAAALTGGRPARLLGAGILALAFGAASARVALTLAPDARLTAEVLLSLASGSRAVDGGLAAAGLLAAASALPGALRHVATVRQWTLALLLLAGLVMSADASAELMRSGGWLATLAVVVVLVALGLLALQLHDRGWWRRLSSRIARASAGARTWTPPDVRARLWLAVAAGGLVLAAVSPHALPILLGAVLAALGAHVALRRMGSVGAVPLLPAAAAVLLGGVAYYLRVIAGPVGLATSHFADVPLSPAAQVALSAPVIIVAGLFGGPILLRRWLPGSGLAVVGVVLLLRLAHPLFGDALPGWESLFVAFGILMLWLAALAGAWSSAAGISAWTTGLVVAPAAPEGAWLLALAALMLALRRWARPVRGDTALVFLVLAAMSGAAGASAGLAALLQHQVAYATAALLAGWLLVFGADGSEQVIYSAGSPDLTAHSGAAHGLHASSSPL